MIVVGLTGGIASGKSYVIKYLTKLKIPTHESDNIVNSFYQKPNKNFLELLYKEGFDQAIKKNKIDKKIIRDEIFINQHKRIKLEKFLHKEVKKKRNEFIKKHKITQKHNLIFLDIPLLFENNLETGCDYVCSTIAPVKTREKRALQRTGMSRNIFKRIVKSQVKDKFRRLKSNFIINTTKTKAHTCTQVDNMLYNILKKEK